MLLTDAGFYYHNELSKPLAELITEFKAMLNKPFAEAKILFIPTASMQDKAKAKAIAERLCNELFHMGISPANITIHDIDGTLTEDEAMAFDVIYLTGGSALYLAKRVKESGFDKIIKKMVCANKIYIGMSAGSLLAMPNFDTDGRWEENPKDFAGLALIHAYFTVHCKPGTPNRTDLPLPHIPLKENEAIRVWKDGYNVISASIEAFLM